LRIGHRAWELALRRVIDTTSTQGWSINIGLRSWQRSAARSGLDVGPVQPIPAFLRVRNVTLHCTSLSTLPVLRRLSRAERDCGAEPSLGWLRCTPTGPPGRTENGWIGRNACAAGDGHRTCARRTPVMLRRWNP